MVFYVYGLIDPFNNELRYVGYAKNPKDRLVKHLCPSKLTGFTHKENWIKSLFSRDAKPQLFLLEEFESKEEALQAEIELIAYYRYLGCDLTNTTAGGEGSNGTKIPESHRQRLREINSRPKSEEHKAKISKSHIGIKPSEETLSKLRGRKFTPEHITNLRLAKRGKGNKLTEDDVRYIRCLLSTKTNVEIAKIFNVNPSTISNIRTGDTWDHLQ